MTAQKLLQILEQKKASLPVFIQDPNGSFSFVMTEEQLEKELALYENWQPGYFPKKVLAGSFTVVYEEPAPES